MFVKGDIVVETQRSAFRVTHARGGDFRGPDFANQKGLMPPSDGYRGGICTRATTTCPHTISFLERCQKCGSVELRAIRVANGSRFRKFARHPWRCALADYKLGLAVCGDDQLSPFGQSVHQPGIMIKLTNAYSFHPVRQYRLTHSKSSANLSRELILK